MNSRRARLVCWIACVVLTAHPSLARRAVHRDAGSAVAMPSRRATEAQKRVIGAWIDFELDAVTHGPRLPLQVQRRVELDTRVAELREIRASGETVDRAAVRAWLD